MATVTPAALLLVRDYLPQCWEWTHSNIVKYGQRFTLEKQRRVPDVLSTNMCRHTTLFLLRLLAASRVDGWRPAGGFMRTRAGFLEPHYWLENGQWIVDLTADQFGWDPIVLTSVSDARYNADKAMSASSQVTTLKGTVRQWEGGGASFWQEHAPAYLKMKAEYPSLVHQFTLLCTTPADAHLEDCQERFATTPAAPQ